MLDHVSIPVSNLAQAASFYDAASRPSKLNSMMPVLAARPPGYSPGHDARAADFRSRNSGRRAGLRVSELACCQTTGWMRHPARPRPVAAGEGGHATRKGKSADAELSEEELKRLESLGYIDRGESDETNDE